MRKNIIIIWLSVILTALACCSALLLKSPPDWPVAILGFHVQLIMNIIVGAAHVTGAVLFLANLDVYKTKLRRAYIILAIGATLTGVGTLQNTLLTLLNMWSTPYGSSGLTMLPFLLSGLTLFVAVRLFARLIGVKYLLTRFSVVIPVALLLVVLSTFLPHATPPRMKEEVYDLLVGITVWSGALMIFAGHITHRMQKLVGQHYVHAIKWLKRALVTSGIVLLYVGFYTLIDKGFDITVYAFNGMTTIVSGLVWVRAGYAFALTKYSSKNISLFYALFGQDNTRDDKAFNSVIDMVTSTAGLVSNSRDIDPMLDKVRTITSRLQPGERLSSSDTRELIKVYLEIEEYLVTKEAIRTFTQKELRMQLSPELRELIDSQHK